MFETAKFTAIARSSRLTGGELASIYGTTRQTIYNWRKGMLPSQRALVARAKAANNILYALINAAKPVLPFPENLSKEAREERITKITKRVLLETKP